MATPDPCRCAGCLASIPPTVGAGSAVHAAHADHLRKLAAIGALPDPDFHPYYPSPVSYSEECPTCGEIMPRANHKCPPAWLVRNVDEDESEAIVIYDHTAPGAAEKFCIRMDEGESKPRDRKVIVERKADGAALRLGPCQYDMRAELVAQYLPF